jgi:polar amino acid transport system substrate-binding protein
MQYPPYAIEDPNTPSLVRDILDEVFANEIAGYQLDFLPLKRIINHYEEKKYLVFLSRILLSPEKQKQVDYISIANTTLKVMYRKKDKDKFKNQKTQKGLNFAVFRGAVNEERYAKTVQGKIINYSKREQGYKMLSNNRVDAIFCLEKSCTPFLEQNNNLTTKTVLPIIIEIFTKKGTYTEELKMIRSRIKTMKENGRYQKILKAYGL